MRNFSVALLAAVCLAVLALSGGAQSTLPPPPVSELRTPHPLLGSWLAQDGTVFIFRPDGTFHGFDYRHREIWGNWVTLSPSRIGFQSLLHDSSYRPQYAIINKDDQNAMNYIGTGGHCFIKAARIPLEKAEAAVEVVVEPQVYHPGEPDSADKAAGE